MGKFALTCDEWLSRGVGLLVGIALGLAAMAIGAQAWAQEVAPKSDGWNVLGQILGAAALSAAGGIGIGVGGARRWAGQSAQVKEVLVVQLGDRDFGEIKAMRKSLHKQGNAHTKTHGLLFAIADHLKIQVDETALDADSDEPEEKP